MPFDTQEKTELRSLLDELRSMVALDTRAAIQEELLEVKEQLNKLFRMESEDVDIAYQEIEALKKRMAKLEQKIAHS